MLPSFVDEPCRELFFLKIHQNLNQEMKQQRSASQLKLLGGNLVACQWVCTMMKGVRRYYCPKSKEYLVQNTAVFMGKSFLRISEINDN